VQDDVGRSNEGRDANDGPCEIHRAELLRGGGEVSHSASGPVASVGVGVASVGAGAGV